MPERWPVPTTALCSTGTCHSPSAAGSARRVPRRENEYPALPQPVSPCTCVTAGRATAVNVLAEACFTASAHPPVPLCARTQARTYMYFLRNAHIGEVTVSIWPDELKKICSERNIKLLE